jgi:nitrogenase subunit NifH
MRQIAIYGKGGIGKSTVSSNLSMAFREMGLVVMQVGCDPKRDSTRSLTGGRMIPTVLETLRDNLRAGRDQSAITLQDIVFPGAGGVYCVESGGPEPGIGCAGRGVLTALQILKDLKAFQTFGVDVVLYDILGDVVCGGFAQPIREGFAQEIYLLCSGSFMSLYAANNTAWHGAGKAAWRGSSATAQATKRSKERCSRILPRDWARSSSIWCRAARSYRPAKWRAGLCWSIRPARPRQMSFVTLPGRCWTLACGSHLHPLRISLS